jgi:two-component system nitrogen regulation response regulator GlnG
MQTLVDKVEQYADSDAPVLILGEAGTGRELIARVLHYASPRRAKGQFVAMRARMAPQQLHYDPSECTSDDTLEAAAGGTLLIKELCDLPKASQRTLKRIIDPTSGARARSKRARRRQSNDVRVVGSCDLDLGLAADASAFNRDLYKLLSKHRLDVPPLRDRVADVPRLTGQCIRQYSRELGRGRFNVSTRAVERLQNYPWPGNVAELKGICRRLVLRAKRSRIEAGDVDAVLPVVAERVPLEDMPFEDMVRSKLGVFLRRMDGYALDDLYEQVLSRVERPLFQAVLEHTGGNQVRAAEILGLARGTLRRKLGDRGVEAKPARAAARTRKKTSSPRTKAASTKAKTTTKRR